MIKRGANPHVLNYNGNSEYNIHSLDSLPNVPTIKSVSYPIKSFPSGNLNSPFRYKSGVYPGQFGQVIGKGAEGIVIQGVWNNEKAAYKFVEVRDQKLMSLVKDGLADMNARVREMIEMESITGSNILKFNGHFR